METHNLSELDRTLISDLTAALNRLATIQEQQQVEKVYTNREAAKILEKSEQTISRYLKQGRLKRAVRGGVAGIPESELTRLKSTP